MRLHVSGAHGQTRVKRRGPLGALGFNQDGAWSKYGQSKLGARWTESEGKFRETGRVRDELLRRTGCPPRALVEIDDATGLSAAKVLYIGPNRGKHAGRRRTHRR